MEIYQILLGLSLAMAVGLLFTRIVKPFNLPNVTGYLIGGMLVGPSVLNLINSETTESFNIIVTLALGFIAFSIGCEFKLKHLKEIGGKVTVITIFQALTAVVFVFVTLLLLGFDLPIVFVLSAIATATALPRRSWSSDSTRLRPRTQRFYPCRNGRRGGDLSLLRFLLRGEGALLRQRASRG